VGERGGRTARERGGGGGGWGEWGTPRRKRARARRSASSRASRRGHPAGRTRGERRCPGACTRRTCGAWEARAATPPRAQAGGGRPGHARRAPPRRRRAAVPVRARVSHAKAPSHRTGTAWQEKKKHGTARAAGRPARRAGCIDRLWQGARTHPAGHFEHVLIVS